MGLCICFVKSTVCIVVVEEFHQMNLFTSILLVGTDPVWASVNLGIMLCINCSGEYLV